MSPLWVEGQVVEYKVRPGAKMHFLTLRDLQTDTSMTVTAWAGVMDSTPLTEGARVVTRVKPVFWERSGRLNLQAAEIHLQGVGDLLAQIEALRARLAAEGLFAERRKKPLPFLPRTIGLICGRGAKAEAAGGGPLAAPQGKLEVPGLGDDARHRRAGGSGKAQATMGVSE